MKLVNSILNEIPCNDLNLYFELGNIAGSKGELEQSIQWYIKGLNKARELKDEIKIKEFSALIMLHL